MKNYTIYKGSHYSLHLPKAFIKNPTNIDFNFKLDENCLYKPLSAENLEDISKIFGLSFGLHHTNSYRVGFAYGYDNFSLFHYWYNNGVRNYRKIFSCKPGDQISGSLKINRKDNIINTFYYNKENSQSSLGSVAFDFSKIPNWGYYLFPYYGGNEVAQQKMDIGLEFISC